MCGSVAYRLNLGVGTVEDEGIDSDIIVDIRLPVLEVCDIFHGDSFALSDVKLYV